MPATTAYQGRGSHLATSPDGTTYTNVAQLRNIKSGGMKADLDDVTNLDSPSAFKEFIATIVDAGEISYDGILNPIDPTTMNLITLLQNQTLTFFKVTLVNGSLFTFKGYVIEHMPFEANYAKAITFSGKIKITGPITQS